MEIVAWYRRRTLWGKAPRATCRWFCQAIFFLSLTLVGEAGPDTSDYRTGPALPAPGLSLGISPSPTLRAAQHGCGAGARPAREAVLARARSHSPFLRPEPARSRARRALSFCVSSSITSNY